MHDLPISKGVDKDENRECQAEHLSHVLLAEALVVLAGFHLESFPWGGRSLGSNLFVGGAVISMWCCDVVSMP